MKVLGFVGRLRAAPAPASSEAAGSSDSAPAKLTATEALDALQQLDSERSEVRRALTDLQERRRALLLRDAPDSEISKVDRDADRLHVQLEKLDLAEPLLCQAAGDATLQEKRERLSEITEAFSALVRGFCEAMTVATRMRNAMITLRAAAAGSGFEGFLPLLELPLQTPPTDFTWIANYEAGALATLRSATIGPAPRAVFPVTFAKHYQQWRSGETAGFSADLAKALVAAGIACWAGSSPAERSASAEPAEQAGDGAAA